MHFLLVGPGALGCLLCSVVSKGMTADDSLTILDYNSSRAARLTEEGIGYHLDGDVSQIPVTAVSEPGLLGHVDIVLLCVKSYDVESSLEFCRPILKKGVLVLFMQNGISHLEVQDHLYDATAAFGTTTEGATLLGTGQVRHAGSGSTFLGFLEETDKQAENLLQKCHDLFARGGLQVQLTDNILTRLWAKLFINVGINALTAILGCKNGELLTLPNASSRMETAIGEAMQIARKKNIQINQDPYQITRNVCKKTAKNLSSMLQDVRSKRRTEIDAINGAIVTFARSFAIETPENELLCRQVKAIEAGYEHSGQ